MITESVVEEVSSGEDSLAHSFFAIELDLKKRESLVIDAYHRNIAPYLARHESCSLESARLYVKYIESLGVDVAVAKWPWVPVGSVGCLPVIGHLDPVRFEQASPIPQWFAPRVLITESFYINCMERLHEAIAQASSDEWYQRPKRHLPRLRPKMEDPLDTIACLVEYGVFPTEGLGQQRDRLKQWFENGVDEEELAEVLAEDSALAGFDAALKYLEEPQPCVDGRQLIVDTKSQSAIPQAVAEQNDLVTFLDGPQATFVLSPFTERFHLGDLIAQKRGSDREVLFMLIPYQHQRSHLTALEGLKLRELGLEEIPYEASEGEDAETHAEISVTKQEVARIDIKSSENSSEQIVHWLLYQAATMGASDIHIEQTTGSGRVRMRVDGSLITIHKLSLAALRSVLAMLKNTCGMNPSHLDTDDNRFSVHVDNKVIDVRVSAVPFRRGFQKLVLRLLDKGGGFKRLEDLYLPEKHELILRHASAQKQGLILVTGPTGSGKSTTLYALLDGVNQPNSNIHTIEDPIEYELDGLNQTQVNAQRQLTYDRVLRALLRQDPDVIMIGEIRDRDTAEAAANAALTGHLVLSTIHSLSSIKAVRRLTQMGVPPYMLGESLILLQAQRLIRRLCDCKHPVKPSPRQCEQFESQGIKPPSQIYVAAGCPACLDTGYKGRVAVMELCPVDDELAELIAGGAGSVELEQTAARSGFRSLFQEALTQCVNGEIGYEIAMELNQAW